MTARPVAPRKRVPVQGAAATALETLSLRLLRRRWNVGVDRRSIDGVRLAIEAQLFDFFFAAAGFCPVAAELLASFECAAIAGPAPVALRMSPLCCLSSDFLRPKPKKYLPKNPIFSSLAVYAMPVNCCLSISFPGKADSSRERRQPFFLFGRNVQPHFRRGTSGRPSSVPCH